MFWFILIFTSGVFTFWAGQRDGRIFYFIKQLPKKFYGVCVVNKIIITNGRHLGLECYGFYNSRIATRIRKKKILICILFSYIFLFFLKVNTHILKTHFVMEPFAVAAWRHLPSVHPVFKILFPHLRSVMAINNFVRHDFVTRPGVLQLLKKSYKKFKFSMLSLPEVISKNGVEDATKLPGYFYR